MRNIIKKEKGTTVRLVPIGPSITEAVVHVSKKVCSNCKNSKPVDHFDKNTCARDGRATRCRDCRKEAAERKKAARLMELDFLFAF